MNDQPKKKGGRRAGAGRKPKPRTPDVADKGMAARILALAQCPIHSDDCRCEECAWFNLLNAHDQRIQLDARKYLSDKRDGKAVQTVNHVHDKPIEMNVTVSLAETIQKARKRALGADHI